MQTRIMQLMQIVPQLISVYLTEESKIHICGMWREICSWCEFCLINIKPEVHEQRGEMHKIVVQTKYFNWKLSCSPSKEQCQTQLFMMATFKSELLTYSLCKFFRKVHTTFYFTTGAYKDLSFKAEKDHRGNYEWWFYTIW